MYIYAVYAVNSTRSYDNVSRTQASRYDTAQIKKQLSKPALRSKRSWVERKTRHSCGRSLPLLNYIIHENNRNFKSLFRVSLVKAKR